MKYSKLFYSRREYGSNRVSKIKKHSREDLWGEYIKSNFKGSFESFCKKRLEVLLGRIGVKASNAAYELRKIGLTLNKIKHMKK